MSDYNLLNFLNETREAVVIINLEASIVFCNKHAELIAGKQPENLISHKVNESFPDIGVDMVEVLKTGKPRYQHKKINGRTFNVKLVPLFKEKFVYGVAGIFEDSSEIEFLKTENNRLKEAVEEMEDIMESFYDGLGIIDGNGTLLRVNTSYERITGFSKKDNNVGRNVRELQEEGTVSKAVALMVLEQKKPVTIVQRIKTGKEVLITGSPVLSKDGNIYRVVCNIRDIKELNILKELNQQYEKSREALELKELRAKQLSHDNLIYSSKDMKEVFELSLKVAKVDSNVLITGESGVGKEIIAKIIHKASPRAQKSFLQINCGAIPESLLESELFGYEGGAFTGAKIGGKMGYFEISNEGTLLLDEIGELPLNLQVKLLRAIQERQILRIGGNTPYKFDVHIICATNRNLVEMVQDGLFRADLFYRLNVVPINIPPLRKRIQDIIPLAIHFLEKFNSKYETNKRFEPEALVAFERYNWPGNVRELENLVERLVVLNDDEIIGLHHLPFIGDNLDDSNLNIEVLNPIPLRKAAEILETKLVEKALLIYGSTRKAAKILGVSHPTIIRKAQKYNINR